MSLVLIAMDGRDEDVVEIPTDKAVPDQHVPDELLFEILFFDSERRYRAWRHGNAVAVLRGEDELDAVLWVGQVQERLRETGRRLTAGVASLMDPDEPAASWIARAELALERGKCHGGDLIVAHSTTVAMQDATRQFLRCG